MRSMRRIAWLSGLLLVAVTTAGAEQNCRLEGREYPPDVVVCSGGLALYCSNGTWQNNEGQRCDAPTGEYLGPRRPLAEKNDEPIPQFYKDKYPDLGLQ